MVKPLPQNLEAEREVIGAVMAVSGLYDEVAAALTVGDFYHEMHRAIFAACGQLVREGQPIDPISMRQALGKERMAELRLTLGDLAEMASGFVTSAHVQYHSRLIRDAAKSRAYIRLGQAIVQKAEESESALGLEDTVLEMFAKIQGGVDAESLASPDRLVGDYCQEIEQRIRDKGKRRGVIPTGFYDLDNMLTVSRGNLIIIGARPAIGKTSFALNIARRVATTLPVLFYSLEMSRQELMERMVAELTGIDTRRQKSGDLDEDQHAALIGAGGEIARSKLMVDDRGTLTATQVRGDVSRLVAKGKAPAVVFVDYLQLMQQEDARANRTQGIGQISRDLKRIARDFGCAVYALSQLSRAVEGRDNNLPRMSDLRESGDIEANADSILLLHREEYYAEQEKRKAERPGRADVLVAKQRAGPAGQVELKFDRSLTRFSDAPYEPGEAP